MRVSVLQENLAKGLSIVGRAVSTRSTLPVLSNILLSTDEERLKLAATNLEVGVSCWLGAQIEDDGAVTLPARLLTDWVNSVTPDRIDMELSVRSMSVHLKCGRFESNIKGIDASEFPLIPTGDGEEPLNLPPATLRKIIDQVVFAAADAKDTSRPALTGVLARFEGDRLTLAATDGYRLSLRRTALPAAAPADISVIVPARSLQEVSRISGEADPEQPVELAVAAARNQILFRLCGKGEAEKGTFYQVALVSQLIDAKFPDFNAIIPKSYTTRTILDTAALQRALKVASLFARDASDRVIFSITPGETETAGRLTVRATSAEAGDNVSELDAVVEGAAVEIAFNVRYMMEVIAVIDTPEVVLETTRSDRPGVFRPVGAGPEEFTHVIMPMQLQR
ncbi:MAG: DNA polymerase III subunit beta [Chloroflexi bacterium ADurb.Bin325]|nr:MAG: DNA polymerase III subunit beta [Chloroflexi bacterium ADurb.Bin325]